MTYKPLVRITFLLICLVGCQNDDPVYSPEAVVLNSLDWQGHKRTAFKTTSSNGELVYFHLYSPASAMDTTPVIIGIHGATGSKSDWSEIDGYGKGGNLVIELLDRGYSFLALDLSHHGEHYLHEPIDDMEEFFLEHWELFYNESLIAIEPVVYFAKNSGLFDTNRLGVVCYSLGGIFINQTASTHGGFKSLVYLAASTGRNEDPRYGPVSHQEGLEDVNAYLVAGENDEIVPFEDSQWLFEQLVMGNKSFVSYPSGHSLPVDYVVPLADWLSNNL